MLSILPKQILRTGAGHFHIFFMQIVIVFFMNVIVMFTLPAILQLYKNVNGVYSHPPQLQKKYSINLYPENLVVSYAKTKINLVIARFIGIIKCTFIALTNSNQHSEIPIGWRQ